MKEEGRRRRRHQFCNWRILCSRGRHILWRSKLPVSCVWHRYPASICIRLRIHLLHPLITDFWLIQFFPFTVCSTKVFDFVFIAGMIYRGGINRICNLIARVMAKSLANERKISKQFVILIYGLAKIFPIMRGKSWLISVYIA